MTTNLIIKANATALDGSDIGHIERDNAEDAVSIIQRPSTTEF